MTWFKFIFSSYCVEGVFLFLFFSLFIYFFFNIFVSFTFRTRWWICRMTILLRESEQELTYICITGRSPVYTFASVLSGTVVCNQSVLKFPLWQAYTLEYQAEKGRKTASAYYDIWPG